MAGATKVAPREDNRLTTTARPGPARPTVVLSGLAIDTTSETPVSRVGARTPVRRWNQLQPTLFVFLPSAASRWTRPPSKTHTFSRSFLPSVRPYPGTLQFMVRPTIITRAGSLPIRKKPENRTHFTFHSYLLPATPHTSSPPPLPPLSRPQAPEAVRLPRATPEEREAQRRAGRPQYSSKVDIWAVGALRGFPLEKRQNTPLFLRRFSRRFRITVARIWGARLR